jgi:hypothetical protein
MSYQDVNLVAYDISNAGSRNAFAYTTIDSMADVQVSGNGSLGYWNGAGDKLRKGDFIRVTASDGLVLLWVGDSLGGSIYGSPASFTRVALVAVVDSATGFTGF